MTETCAEGDVILVQEGIPFILWNGNWSPICGHWFWDNDDGANAFCRKLGLTGGSVNKEHAAYSVDAIEIGSCRSADTMDSCTGGHNEYKNTGVCHAGSPVKITISCDGIMQGSQKKSCKGKVLCFT